MRSKKLGEIGIPLGTQLTVIADSRFCPTLVHLLMIKKEVIVPHLIRHECFLAC